MKRILILTACVVLGTALAANASVTVGNIQGTLVPLSPTQNEIDLSVVAGATGWPLDGLGQPKLVNGIDVTCVTIASEPGATLHLGGVHNADQSGNWANHVMSNGYQDVPGTSPASPAESYFNFDTKVDALVNAGTFPNVTSFTGSAIASFPSGYLSPTGNSFLGSIIVNNGMWVHMTGSLIFSDTSTQAFDVVVPEPSTLALLIAGVALLGLRWLRRR